MEAVYKVSH